MLTEASVGRIWPKLPSNTSTCLRTLPLFPVPHLTLIRLPVSDRPTVGCLDVVCCLKAILQLTIGKRTVDQKYVALIA